MGKLKSPTVPRKASRGMGASHRRHGTGGGMRSKVGVLWRPPDGAKRRRGALAELGQRPKGCECDGVGTRRVETPRGKRVERAATHRVNIASHGSKGSFILNDGLRSYGWLDNLLDRLGCKVTVVIDACYSGSAITHLDQPGREVYVACGEDELSTGEYDRRFAEALGGVEADVDGDGVVEMCEADRWGRWMKWTIGNGIAIRSDYDKDGLADDVEQNDSFWESLGVPVNEYPDWEIPDIYVELDWMEGAEHNIFGLLPSWLWMHFGDTYLPSEPFFYIFLIAAIISIIAAILLIPSIIGFIVGFILFVIFAVLAVIMIALYYSDSSIEEIFENHNINFHVDDGSWDDGTGYDSIDPLNHIGGGMVPFEVPNYGAGEQESTWGSDHDYFSHIRNGYFFYCLFTRSRISDDEWGSADYTGTCGDFWVDSSNSTDIVDLADLFLHELGHLLLMEIDEEHLDVFHDPHCHHEDCTMWWGNNKANSVNYCEQCWVELERDGIAEGSIPKVYLDE